jgi:hypothetical protein
VTITALGSLATVLIALKPWAEQALKVEQEHRNDVRMAATRVLDALNATEAYLNSGTDSQSTESNLVSAWHTAASSLYGVNQSLAELCYLKGEHWKKPSALTSTEIDDAGLSIDQIKIAIEKLLFPTRFTN